MANNNYKFISIKHTHSLYLYLYIYTPNVTYVKRNSHFFGKWVFETYFLHIILIH